MDQRAPVTPSVASICDALGRTEIATRVERTPSAISNAVRDGVFPPSWFLVIKAMCGEKGVECPESLFSFIPEAAQQDGADGRPDE